MNTAVLVLKSLLLVSLCLIVFALILDTANDYHLIAACCTLALTGGTGELLALLDTLGDSGTCGNMIEMMKKVFLLIDRSVYVCFCYWLHSATEDFQHFGANHKNIVIMLVVGTSLPTLELII